MDVNKDDLQLSPWKHWLRESVIIYPDTRIVSAGNNRVFTLLTDMSFPKDFVDEQGTINEPYITWLAKWMIKYSKIVDGKITLGMIVPYAIKCILNKDAQKFPL